MLQIIERYFNFKLQKNQPKHYGNAWIIFSRVSTKLNVTFENLLPLLTLESQRVLLSFSHLYRTQSAVIRSQLRNDYPSIFQIIYLDRLKS